MLRALLKLLGLAALLLLGWVLLVSLAPGTWIAAGAPCPRNLAWGDAWLLRASPLESLSFPLPGGGKGKLCYGSPSLKGRKMIGGTLPYGHLWRLGANEATELETGVDLTIGGQAVPKGKYTLYALPTAARWTLIVSKSTSTTPAHDPALDLVRIDLRKRTLTVPVESFAINLIPSTQANAPPSGELRIMWGTTELSTEWVARP